jgi:hypothetical protein
MINKKDSIKKKVRIKINKNKKMRSKVNIKSKSYQILRFKII